MIITEFLEGQGLGNQLWMHAAGCSIAEQLGMPYLATGLDHFKGASFLEIKNSPDALSSGGPPQGIARFYEKLYFDPELNAYMCDFDTEVLNIAGPTLISGYFQSEKYFFGDLSRICRYVNLKAEWQKQCVDERTCILNVRGGEYKRHKNLCLPESYWIHAMRTMSERHQIKNFLVVTDDTRYARALFPTLPILEGGVAACYAALFHARYVVLSNSSFSYFPVKGGRPKMQVIAPMHWARFANPLRRWASPANVYSGWEWQDATGNLHDYLECQRQAEATSDYYHQQYYVATTMGATRPPLWREHIPAPVRFAIKRALGRLFPTRIG